MKKNLGFGWMRLLQLSEDPTNIDLNQYKDVKPHGISLALLLETYNSCMIQPNPEFVAELNYYSIEKGKIIYY